MQPACRNCVARCLLIFLVPRECIIYYVIICCRVREQIGLCAEVCVASLGQTIAIEHFQEAQLRRKIHSPVFRAETLVQELFITKRLKSLSAWEIVLADKFSCTSVCLIHNSPTQYNTWCLDLFTAHLERCNILRLPWNCNLHAQQSLQRPEWEMPVHKLKALLLW